MCPNAVRAPPPPPTFPGRNLNQNINQYYCRTNVHFICCRCSLCKGNRLWRWFLVSRSFLLGHRALFLAWTNRFLNNQLDKGTFLSCCQSHLGAISGICSANADLYYHYDDGLCSNETEKTADQLISLMGITAIQQFTCHYGHFMA